MIDKIKLHGEYLGYVQNVGYVYQLGVNMYAISSAGFKKLPCEI